MEFARFADFGIDDIRKVDNTVISSHQQYDEEGNATKTVTFPFRVNESEGTIKYFSLAYPIIDALDHGKGWLSTSSTRNAPSVDQSHHRAVQFQSDKSQECTVDFTTHDTNLLNASLFRRDQIWFTQKDSFGASELYSLAEYKVRNSAPFERST